MSNRVEGLRKLVDELRKWPGTTDDRIHNEMDRLVVMRRIAYKCQDDVTVENVFRLRAGMKVRDLVNNIDKVLDIYRKICSTYYNCDAFEEFLDEVYDTGDDMAHVAFAKAICDYFLNVPKSSYIYLHDIDVSLLEDYYKNIAQPVNVLTGVIDFEKKFDAEYKYHRSDKKGITLDVDLKETPIEYDKEKAKVAYEPRRVKYEKASDIAYTLGNILTILVCILGYGACALLGFVMMMAAEGAIGVFLIIFITFGLLYTMLIVSKHDDLDDWCHDVFDVFVPAAPKLEHFAKDEINARVLAVRSSYKQIGSDPTVVVDMIRTCNIINSTYKYIVRDLKYSMDKIDIYCKLFIDGTVSTIREAAEYCRISNELEREKKETEEYIKRWNDAFNAIRKAKQEAEAAERRQREFEKVLSEARESERERNKALGEIRDSLKDLKNHLDD